MAKDLKFKLVLDADVKDFVSNTKQAEDVTKKVFNAIKAGAEEINQTKLAENLAQQFTDATREIQALGDKSVISAGELRSMSSTGEQGLKVLNNALRDAQAELIRLQSTDGTLLDIEIAKGRVFGLEDSIKQVSSAFDHYKSVATNAMEGVDNAASRTIAEVQKFTSVDLSQVVGEAQSATRAIQGMGDGANISTKEVERIGLLGAKAIDSLERELESARRAWQALIDAGDNVTLEELTAAKGRVVALEKALDLTENSLNDFKTATGQATPVVDEFESELKQTNKELSNTETASQKANREVASLKTGFNAVTGAMAALGLGVTASELAKTADEFKTLEARVKLSTGATGDFDSAMVGVKAIALETRAELTGTAELFSRVNTAVKDLGYSQGVALEVTRLINQAMVVGGGSAESNAAAITQLNQALQSGVLRGEEFNSMMEQSPRLSRALADGLGVTLGELRKMANEGKLATDVVIKALQSQSEAIQKEFSVMPVTIGQSITNLKTSWMIYLGELDKTHGVSEKVANALAWVAENLDEIAKTLEIAAKAFIAYKALDIAAFFMDKAKKISLAVVEIGRETTALITNTQAQIANARATQGAATAKTGLATAATNSSRAVATSTASTGMSLGTLVGRLSTLGIAITALGILVPTVLNPLGTAIGEGVAKLQGYGDALEKLDRQLANEAAAAKAAADGKELMAKAAEEGKIKTYQLSEASVQLSKDFEKLVKDGKEVSDALKEISNSMKFDSLSGIDEAISALNMLERTGKITSEELQSSLKAALSDEDLVVFQANAKAAFAGTAQEANKMAQVTQAVMTLALERTGLSTEQLKGQFSKTFQSASNDIQMMIGNLKEYEAQGVDTGLALSASINKAIDTAQTQAELDYAKRKLIEFGEQGLISGEQAALGLSKVEQKANSLPSALNPAIAAFNALGIKTKDQLEASANAAKANFEVVNNSGKATADGIRVAYTKMLESVLATGNKSEIAIAQAKAASLGLAVQVDETGKATVQSMAQAEAATQKVAKAAGHDATKGFKDMGDAAKKAGEEAREASKQTENDFRADMKAMGDGLARLAAKYRGMTDDYKNQMIALGASAKEVTIEAEKMYEALWKQTFFYTSQKDAVQAMQDNIKGMKSVKEATERQIEATERWNAKVAETSALINDAMAASAAFQSKINSIQDEYMKATGQESKMLEMRYRQRKQQLTLEYEMLKVQIATAKVAAEAAKLDTKPLEKALADATAGYAEAQRQLIELEKMEKAKLEADKKLEDAKKTTDTAKPDETKPTPKPTDTLPKPPQVNINPPAVDLDAPQKTVKYELNLNGQSVEVFGDPSQESLINAFMDDLERYKRGM